MNYPCDCGGTIEVTSGRGTSNFASCSTCMCILQLRTLLARHGADRKRVLARLDPRPKGSCPEAEFK